MASLAKYYSSDLVGFFSYSREDDTDFNEVLSKFRVAIQAELSAQLGRNRDNFRIWQDKFAIADGTLWRNQITDGIKQASFFIPIVTPRVVNSPHCAFEFNSFIERERELGRDDLVFPILYIRVPELDDGTWQQSPVLKLIKERQYLDWRNFRYRPLESPEVAERIGQFCLNIANALRKSWLSPEECLQQRDAAAQQQAAIQRALEDETQRQAAEAARIADEAKRRAQEQLEAQQREAATAAQRAQEQQAFTATKRAGTIAACDEFLAAHPSSEFAGEAQKLKEGLLARQEAHRRAMASDDVALLRAFRKTYQSGADVDEVQARLSGLAPRLDWKSSRPVLAAAATIAIILCGGVLVWVVSRPSSQLASVPPSGSTANAATTAAQSPPMQNTPLQSPKIADASSPTLPPASAVPPKSPPSWAECSPNPTPNDKPMGEGDVQVTPIRLLLTKAQQDVIAVRTIAVSPDGKTLVTAGDDAVIRIWDAASFRRKTQITGHQGPVYSVAFSADGNSLASASFDGTVQIWDTHSFAHVHTFTARDDKGQAVKQYSVAFVPVNNPQYVYSAGADGNVWIWDVRKQVFYSKLSSYTGNGDPTIESISFELNSPWALATANSDGTIRFFDRDRSQVFPAYSGKALRLAYSPDGTLIASAGADVSGKSMGLEIWSNTTRVFKAISAHKGHVASVAWSRDGTRLATGGGYSDPSVALWDVQSGKQVPQFNGHTKDVEAKEVENRDVEAVAFHPNQKWLISASETGKMKIWDVNAGNELLSIVSIPGGDEYVAYTPSGCYTGSANAANYVRYVTPRGDQSGTALLVPNGATDFLLPQP